MRVPLSGCKGFMATEAFIDLGLFVFLGLLRGRFFFKSREDRAL